MKDRGRFSVFNSLHFQPLLNHPFCGAGQAADLSDRSTFFANSLDEALFFRLAGQGTVLCLC